jgi:hypothetical protein
MRVFFVLQHFFVQSIYIGSDKIWEIRNKQRSGNINGEYVPECPCKAIDLRLAPEDNGLDIDV